MPDIQKRKLKEFSSAPTRASVMKDQQFVAGLPWWLKKVTAFGAPGVHLFTFDRVPEYMQISDIVGYSLADAYSGQKPLKAALDDGQAKLIKLFKEAGYLK